MVTHKISTAVLLAAGTGSRLQPLTFDAPKCLTEVMGEPILGRLVQHLRAQGFRRMIVVLGHLGDHIKAFLQTHAADMQIDYVVNPDYRTTNNIYSLWLARQLISEPFMLIESDLVFGEGMLDELLQSDSMAVSQMLPWMNGTTVEVGVNKSEMQVSAFRMGAGDSPSNVRQYKTVNIYSLSVESWFKVEARLNRYISEERLGEYYESVFAELVSEGSLCFDAVMFDSARWYEIDTLADLRAAEALFSSPQPDIPANSVISHNEVVSVA
ncbi:MAG TPA: phosphocholine cytidylyltransferase family protein [Chromatiales bacterium]|jgi:choline kinase|nr:phosphocholine cytidylyltransferase family protein [Chromatiaceae bacterium]HIO14271.1 phosphocholine cytidylyltransferase family protein [Chromatiales bacterium]HIO54780.1 phosphocholine cytidylyltransferase family protein [Chromatiales bacterium]